MKTILSGLLLTFCISSFAQVPSGYTASFDWGPIHEVDGQQTIAHVDSQYIYTFAVNNGEGWDREKWFFSKYTSDDFTQIWQIETEPLEWRDSDLGFEQVRVIDGDFFVFYNAFDSDRDRMTLLAQKITGDGEMGDLHPLEFYPTDDTREGNFEIRWNRDKTKFMVVAIPQFIRDERAEFKLRTFDLEFTELWEHREKLRTHHENFHVADYVYGHDDRIYLLAFEMPNLERGGRDRDNESNQTYSLYRIEPGQQKFDLLDLDLAKYFVTSPWIYVDEHAMHIGGMYSVEDFEDPQGMFFMTVDTENFAVASRMESDIPEQISERFTSRGLSDFLNNTGRPFAIDHFVRREDGGAIIIEQVRYEEVDYEVTATVMGVPVAWREIITQHYEDYLFLSIDAQGQLEWISHIPLDQEFLFSTLFMGDLLMANGDKLHLIFNDDKDNIEEWGDEEPNIDSYSAWSLRRGNITMVTINADGTIQYEAIGTTRDDDGLYFIPSSCYPIGRNSPEAAVFSFDDEDVRIGILRLD